MKKGVDAAQLDAELRNIISLQHRDPHHVLGVHPDGDGVVIRAYRPDATAIVVKPEFGGSVPMLRLRNGIFEARLNGREGVFKYLLEVSYPGNKTFTLRDPYSFLPTLGEMDLYFAGEGKHARLWERLGAHLIHQSDTPGVSFAVWAPMAIGVSVIGDFNSWDGRLHAMRALGSSGIWELFVPEIAEGARYKFEIRPRHGGPPILKSDPFAFRTEAPPATISVVHDLTRFEWSDANWMKTRGEGNYLKKPMSIYELHLGSWRRVLEDARRPLSYREAASQLVDYIKQMGFTHLEFMPLAEHPFGGSWGYQVGNYFAPTARFGHPDDLRFLINQLHENGIGVLMDWVPGHFPKDAHGLARFDGTAVYEHADPRKGYQPDWGTLVFNLGRNEVRNFLIANALFWIDQYHVDGLRVDAVASMLYLDYSRKPGEWVPNKSGGRENEEAVAFFRELNTAVRRDHPGALMIAEESTSWPKVSAPVSDGGLGFHLKWNMGWMHDTLEYFQMDPFFRQNHHHKLTFGMMYAYSEHFVLPLSHDEVVHGKGSLINKMAGTGGNKFANLRALLTWMWSYSGRKLLFMGGEIAQFSEWNHDGSVDWHVLEQPEHRGVQKLVERLNSLYRSESALHDLDSWPAGFQWIQADARQVNVYSFVRRGEPGSRPVVCVANLSPVSRAHYRTGLPGEEVFHEILNTDSLEFGGTGVATLSEVRPEKKPWDGQPASAELTLPPMGILWLAPDPPQSAAVPK